MGPAVITGEAIRTRRCARPMAVAIRWAIDRPRPGENHGLRETPFTEIQSESNSPVPMTCCFDQSSSKSRSYAAAKGGDWAMTITFSSRVHESSVQFIEPVHTDSPSRTAYFWCIKLGMPGMARAVAPSVAMNEWSVLGGGGTGNLPA